MKRPLARLVSRVLAGVLVFAQLAISAYACPALAPVLPAMATQVVAADAAEPGGSRHADCADMAVAADPTTGALCAEHCKYGTQSDKVPTLNLAPSSPVPVYGVPRVPEAALPSPRLTAASLSALVAASPPRMILHCVYRI